MTLPVLEGADTREVGLEEVRNSAGRLLAAERRLRGADQRRGGGLTHAHVRALFVLLQEQEATAGTLARVAELNPASVTAMIDQLEGLGLVQRRRDGRDRRVCWVSLTEAGKAQVAEKQRVWHDVVAEAFEGMSDRELGVAAKGLERLAEALERLGGES
ncbi:MAG: winged helix-turn-helix transcriptional regulator [Acidimicrobiaceae bacterium]|nr:winged helix-turn-helix transcriptional regulator [Acidimicrobiaceae bacterium]